MDLLDREKVLKAIEEIDIHDIMNNINTDRRCGFEWTKYDIYKKIKNMPCEGVIEKECEA